MKHHTIETLDWRDIGEGWQRASVTLERGDTAFNPGTTKHLIYGPASVTYERGPSGAIRASVA